MGKLRAERKRQVRVDAVQLPEGTGEDEYQRPRMPRRTLLQEILSGRLTKCRERREYRRHLSGIRSVVYVNFLSSLRVFSKNQSKRELIPVGCVLIAY